MKKVSLLAAVLVVFLAVGGKEALAGGSEVYPNGAEAFMCGMVPPPGLHYVNYNLMYTAHRYNDNDGDEIEAGPLDGFKINLYANVSRVIYVTKKEILGANWGVHTLIPFVDVDLKSKAFSDHDIGLGDIFVNPFILSWHREKYHMACGLDIILPTGDYKKHDVANVGKNLFVFEPGVAATVFLPHDISLSGKLMYDVPSSNNDYVTPMGTEVTLRPGQELHMDYSIDKGLKSGLRGGLTGYYYRQLSTDEWDGKKVAGPPGDLGETLAVGPGLFYHKDRLCLSLRSQFELYSKNRPQGQGLWAKLIYSF